MATCNDCLHNAVCALWRANECQDAKCYSENGNEWECDFFADKSRCIELPCKINSKIYMLVTKRHKIHLPEFTFVKETYLTYTNLRRVIEDYGKEIFLTREEAEAALEERTKGEENGYK